jgi:hypothetical protein
MFNAPTRRMIDQFNAQFTPDGDGYIFRRYQKGAAVRVSAAEYRDFVDHYARTTRRIYWGFVIGLSVMIPLVVVWQTLSDIDADSTAFAASIYVPLFALTGVFLWLSTRTYNRPSRALERRVPIEGALSRDAFFRRYYSATSWQKLLGPLVIPLAGGAVLLSKNDILHGWNRLWFGLIAFYLFAAGRLIWRKWRYTAPAQ